MRNFRTPLSSLLLAVAIVTTGCMAQTDDVGSSREASTQVQLCVYSLSCGGFCGTEREVRRFLARCEADPPNGPCFQSCWSACRHSGERSGRLVACTEECRFANCPAEAARAGLVHAGHIDCPAPDPAAICYAIYRPVDCGGCVYSNDCVAAAAGFAGGCTDLGTTVGVR